MKNELLLLASPPEFLLGPLSQGYVCHPAWTAENLAQALEQASGRIRGIVMAGGTVVPPALLEKLPALEILAVNGVGYDGVPLEVCRARGLRVTNTPDVLTDDVADIALSLVLMTSRGLVRANRDLHAGRWADGFGRLTHAVGGKKAGIVGLGRIGKAIARRLEACGMEIGYQGRTRQEVAFQFFDSLPALAEWSDFLVIACPGGAATRHLIDASILAALGTKGTLINISRGSVVDEEALISALENGVIAGAGLDVYEHEPHVPEALLKRDEVVLLPHVGSATRETRGAMAQLVIDNLAAHFAGRPLLTPVL